MSDDPHDKQAWLRRMEAKHGPTPIKGARDNPRYVKDDDDFDFPEHQIPGGQTLWVCPTCWATLPSTFQALKAHRKWHRDHAR